MRTFLFLTVALWGSIGYTGEWVAGSPVAYPPTMVTTPIPTVTYVIPQPPSLGYGWVPHYYNVPVVTERRCWFLRRERQIVYQPQIQWYYQPLFTR